MKRWIHAATQLEADFSWNRKYYARKKGKNPKYYKSDNVDMEDAEEISVDEYCEAAEKYNEMFGG